MLLLKGGRPHPRLLPYTPQGLSPAADKDRESTTPSSPRQGATTTATVTSIWHEAGEVRRGRQHSAYCHRELWEATHRRPEEDAGPAEGEDDPLEDVDLTAYDEATVAAVYEELQDFPQDEPYFLEEQ